MQGRIEVGSGGSMFFIYYKDKEEKFKGNFTEFWSDGNKFWHKKRKIVKKVVDGSLLLTRQINGRITIKKES